MANRVIKDSIWTSPTLAKLSQLADAYWDRFILMADDWGCFDTAPEVIKGTVFPRRKEVDSEEIEEFLQEYNRNGLLFLWWGEDRRWGFFAKWDKHYYSGSTQYGSKGERIKHRRKTPEPAKDQLKTYLKQSGTEWNGLEQSETKGLNPKPNPKHEKDNQATNNILTYLKNNKFLHPIKKEVVDIWLDIYDSDYILTELKEMNAWLTTNPKKRYKNYASFATKWLKRQKQWEVPYDGYSRKEKFPEKKSSGTIDADDYLHNVLHIEQYEKKK